VSEVLFAVPMTNESSRTFPFDLQGCEVLVAGSPSGSVK
jgi:hypothetical protein